MLPPGHQPGPLRWTAPSLQMAPYHGFGVQDPLDVLERDTGSSICTAVAAEETHLSRPDAVRLRVCGTSAPPAW